MQFSPSKVERRHYIKAPSYFLIDALTQHNQQKYISEIRKKLYRGSEFQIKPQHCDSARKTTKKWIKMLFNNRLRVINYNQRWNFINRFMQHDHVYMVIKAKSVY